MGVDLPYSHALRERPHQGHSGRLGRLLVVANVAVVNDIHAPIVFRLTVDCAAPFDGNVFQIFPEKQPVGVIRPVFFGRVQRGARFNIESDVAAQVDCARSVFARRQVDHAASCLRACVDRLLNGRFRVVAFLSRGTIIFDVEHI